jgi:hypothetical protein
MEKSDYEKAVDSKEGDSGRSIEKKLELGALDHRLTFIQYSRVRAF